MGADSPSVLRVWILGRGRVGRGLAAELARTSDPTVAVTVAAARRLPPSVPADVVVLTVPDARVEGVARQVLARMAEGPAPVLLHCAGARGVEAFGVLLEEAGGVAFGAMHPLVSFADPKRPPPLTGTRFAIAGSARARRAAWRGSVSRWRCC